MLNVIQTPVGIDVAIRKLQEYLHTVLGRKWDNTVMDKYQSYARCYRNIRENTYIAEVFTSGKDYKEVYYDDTLAAISFFGIGETIEHNAGQEKIKCHLIYFVNLAKIKLTLTNRADEEVRLDVVKAVADGWFGFEYKSTTLLLPNVLKEYAGTFTKLLNKVDMHPAHCFRLDFTLTYDINNCY